ncbi:MAG: N-acetylmuramoyl-L-alanine amidase family protein [Lachnospiraceae bacterium]
MQLSPNEYKRDKRNRAREKQVRKVKRVIVLLVVVILAAIVLFIWNSFNKTKEQFQTGSYDAAEDVAQEVLDARMPERQVMLLTPNEYSRPQIQLEKVNGIVIHYTANPGTTAANNRDYFEGLKDTKEVQASSHFIIGLDGEIVQCIPTSEIAYASNDRNYDTISIECCHPDESGKFNDTTYQSLVQMTAWLCNRFGLTPSQIYRHYDITGKVCPKYFVDYPDEWQKFLEDVDTERKTY